MRHWCCTLLNMCVQSGAETYYSELATNRGVTWEQAKQVLDDFNAARRDAGLPPSERAGFYKDDIPDWGSTGVAWSARLTCGLDHVSDAVMWLHDGVRSRAAARAHLLLLRTRVGAAGCTQSCCIGSSQAMQEAVRSRAWPQHHI